MKVAATLATLALLIVMQCGSLVHASATLELGSTAKGATTTATLKFTPTQDFNGSSTAGISIPIPGMALGSNATSNSTSNTTAPSRRLLAASECSVLPSSIGGTCALSYASGVLTISLLSGTYTTTVPVSIVITNFQNPTTPFPPISLTVFSAPGTVLFTAPVQTPVLTIPGPYLKPLSAANMGLINCFCVAAVFAISAMNIF
jgi:hypothetical protein